MSVILVLQQTDQSRGGDHPSPIDTELDQRDKRCAENDQGVAQLAEVITQCR